MKQASLLSNGPGICIRNMDCEKCFEAFESQEEYSNHMRGHYGNAASVPSYYSKEDYPMGRDYAASMTKKSWLKKTDMRSLILETHGSM
jgi:hypothetical protein